MRVGVGVGVGVEVGRGVGVGLGVLVGVGVGVLVGVGVVVGVGEMNRETTFFAALILLRMNKKIQNPTNKIVEYINLFLFFI